MSHSFLFVLSRGFVRSKSLRARREQVVGGILSQSPPCIRKQVETVELTRLLEPIPGEEIVGLFPGDILAELINVAGTKGLTALATEALVAGRKLGLQETLLAELQVLPLFQAIERSVPGMPPKASRWVGEMEEIARTFADLGLPAQMPEGAASLYRFVEGTMLGAETPEQRQHGQTLEEVVSILASALAERLPEDDSTS